MTLSARNVPGEKALHALVLVELILRPAKTVAFPLVHDEFDVTPSRHATFDERPALLDRNDRVAVAMQHQEGCRREPIGEMQWRPVAVPRLRFWQRAHERIGVVPLEAIAARRKVRQIRDRVGGDHRGDQLLIRRCDTERGEPAGRRADDRRMRR
jgi:hypothetical protein